MKAAVGNVGIMVATNTALFTGAGHGAVDRRHAALWTLPANMVAAVIATALGLALTRRRPRLRLRQRRRLDPSAPALSRNSFSALVAPDLAAVRLAQGACANHSAASLMSSNG